MVMYPTGIPHENVHRVQNVVVTMTVANRRAMLHDIIDNMVERADPEEIAKFVIAQMGGDAMQVVTDYAGRKA